MTPYWEWVQNEAEEFGSDGCSAVTGLRIDCCFEHDLSFRFARDPRDAYRRWCDGDYHCWAHAHPITFDETNRRFRQCHQNRSRLGRWSPMAIYRWLGVKYGSRAAWDKHRAEEAAEVTGA